MIENISTLSQLAIEIWPDRKKNYPRGAILYWQGDPVDQIYILLDGAVKVSSISLDGKVYAFGIHGVGRLIGAKSYLLDGEHEAVAEVLEPSELLVLSPDEFDHALTTNQKFSSAVMKELAREASDVADRARDLSFLDVQQRLKHSLITLAKEHGVPATTVFSWLKRKTENPQYYKELMKLRKEKQSLMGIIGELTVRLSETEKKELH